LDSSPHSSTSTFAHSRNRTRYWRVVSPGLVFEFSSSMKSGTKTLNQTRRPAARFPSVHVREERDEARRETLPVLRSGEETRPVRGARCAGIPEYLQHSQLYCGASSMSINFNLFHSSNEDRGRAFRYSQSQAEREPTLLIDSEE